MQHSGPLTFAEARRVVLEKAGALADMAQNGRRECHIDLENCSMRILAEDVCADRAYPPVARSTRDGFAIRSNDLPGEVEVVGEVRAGQAATGLRVGPGEAVEIMTGAPVPEGADAVVMVEHVQRKENKRVLIDRTASPGQFLVAAGAEARAGSVVVAAGTRLTYPKVAMLATVGKGKVKVYERPRVSVVTTGDEVIPVDETPQEYQVRNSNAYSLAAQILATGGVPEVLPVARDEYGETRALIERGLEADLLLLSGGVSAGKYDLVEQVLGDLGAEFYFTRVLIQPGQPVVFGRVGEKLFFGLPGNPASTMVTFAIFARAAVEILGGLKTPELLMTRARLKRGFRHKTGLTRFLPAVVDEGGGLEAVAWQGSSDVAALARANAFLVADAERESWDAGDEMGVLLI